VSTSIAQECASCLMQQHQLEHGASPVSDQANGYRRIGSQFEKFVLQARAFKNSERCRQILCANIPQICSDHDIDLDWVYAQLQAMCWGMDSVAVVREVEPFFLAVIESHRDNPTPIKPNHSGCLIPLALCVMVPAALVATRTLG
jgi:hypothetical protein